MTLSRSRERTIYFECDAPRCANVCDTESHDLELALAVMKEEGWTYRKEGSEWKHFCADEEDLGWMDNEDS
jgi:hypothetical protein